MTKKSLKNFLDSPYKSRKHSTYFPVYDYLFAPYKNKNITFVEIGILGGGSLFMWREFFGPKARIIGIDLNPESKMWEEHGFEIYIGNQANEDFWIEFVNQVGEIDLILDDGGHTYEQQVTSVSMLIESVRDGGMMVVEDTHTSYMKGFGSKKYSFINFSKLLIDRINHRCSKLNQNLSEKRIWSIEFFESIVAFKKNNSAVSIASEELFNNGIDVSAKDFRYRDYETKSWIRKVQFLKYIPSLYFFRAKFKRFFKVKK